ncbi:hypothetical protein G9A89_021173 [Geosiphon pyriformis]|nr:hypothetical protein G9A89_021173 [Geosiphon pyriformis]
MAHNLSDLLDSYGEKTCFIGHNPSLYVCNRCIIVCFVDEASKLAAIGSILVFKGVNLCWAGLFLALVTLQDQVRLANIYKKKQMFIAHPMASVSSSHVVLSGFFGAGLSSGAKPVLLVSNSLDNSCLIDHLASLKCFLELLVDQVSDILKKLSFVELVPLMSSPHVSPLVIIASVAANVNSDMVLDITLESPPPPFLVVVDSVANLSSSNSRVLTTKMGGLESKMMALEVSVKSVLDRLDHLCSGLELSTPLTPQ